MVLRNRLCKIILFLQKHRQVAKKTSPTIFGQLEAKAIAQQIIAQGKVDEVLAEKSESVALWNQIVALSKGQENPNGNQHFPGNRPSTLVTVDNLTPKALGALISFYENRTMFQGFLWNLNSFDQEGVELGKVLARTLLEKTPSNNHQISDLIGTIL